MVEVPLGEVRRHIRRRFSWKASKPHGRERLKEAVKSGEGQTAKVVRNDEGGVQRAWKPATRNLTTTQ